MKLRVLKPEFVQLLAMRELGRQNAQLNRRLKAAEQRLADLQNEYAGLATEVKKLRTHQILGGAK